MCLHSTRFWVRWTVGSPLLSLLPSPLPLSLSLLLLLMFPWRYGTDHLPSCKLEPVYATRFESLHRVVDNAEYVSNIYDQA